MLYDWHFAMIWGRNDIKIRQFFTYYLIQRHLMLYDWHFAMTWVRNDTKIRQSFTYYLIQRHLILYDWHFAMTWVRNDTKIRQFFTYYLIRRHLILYDWHFSMTWKSHKVIYPNKHLQDMAIEGWTQVTKLHYMCTFATYCRNIRFGYYSQ